TSLSVPRLPGGRLSLQAVDDDRSACALDLLAGRGGHRLGPNRERAVDLASPEHLHGLTLADHAALQERGRRDFLARLEPGAQGVQVDHGELHPVRVREPLQLGHAALQRHLAALEAELRVVPGAPALRAAARRLPLTGGPAPAHALAGPGRTG